MVMLITVLGTATTRAKRLTSNRCWWRRRRCAWLLLGWCACCRWWQMRLRAIGASDYSFLILFYLFVSIWCFPTVAFPFFLVAFSAFGACPNRVHDSWVVNSWISLSNHFIVILLSFTFLFLFLSVFCPSGTQESRTAHWLAAATRDCETAWGNAAMLHANCLTAWKIVVGSKAGTGLQLWLLDELGIPGACACFVFVLCSSVLLLFLFASFFLLALSTTLFGTCFPSLCLVLALVPVLLCPLLGDWLATSLHCWTSRYHEVDTA